MYGNFKKYFVLASLLTVGFHDIISAVPIRVKCGLESNCTMTTNSEVCILDDRTDGPCIRKFPSKCHMDIAACKDGKNFTDYSSIYCEMETYTCEDEFERWTIFYGHENEINE